MKKFLTFIVALFAVLSYALAQMPALPKLPTDPKTRIGKLDNGLTYYVRHNAYPEKVANFYIAQRVGSIQENDDQRGLAHFLEHMAFNGSTHFKGNEMIEYLRSLGVAFGADLNAYTSIEQTVYNIDNVPTARQTALDSCLLVLQDWSNGLALLPEEIDKERGVIHGEWAMRNSAMQRMLERNLPAMYPGSKYGYRLPIGTMEVVDNFKPEALRAYYEKWYHPENQAIIVIGDIDVDHTEQKIKELFGGIKAHENAAHVTPVEVPDNEEAIYIFDKDKEMQYSIFMIDMKSDPLPREMMNTQMEYMNSYLSDLVCMMFNSRMRELAQEPDCPFIQFTLSYGNYIYSKTKDAFDVTVVAKDGKSREALLAAVRELKRLKEYGFTGGEFVRAKEEFLLQREKAYSNRDKRKHTELYRQCVNHYLDGSAMPDPETDYQIWQALAQQLPLDIINQGLKESITINEDKNLVVACFAQEKDGAEYLSVDDMKAVVAEGRGLAVEAWVDNTKDEPLVSEKNMLKAGKIKSEKKNDVLGYTELTLSNGAKVILKKTDFKNDEVLLRGWADGGKCLYGDADNSNMKLINYVTGTFGLGNFTNNELEKALAGKQANVSVDLSNLVYSGVHGKSTPKDLETMMQLLYLHFTAPQKDEKAYNTLMKGLETQLKNRDLQPATALSDTLTMALYCNNPRFAPLTAADIPNVSLDRCLQIMRERFSNADDFTFTIIGNFDEETIRPLVCKYIASLPGKGKKAGVTDVRTLFKGNVVKDFKRKMETPQPSILQVLHAQVDNTLENDVLATYVGEVLSQMLLKDVREDAGAAYSCGAYLTVAPYRFGTEVMMQVYAPISTPEKVDIALDLIKQDIDKLSETADAEIVAKVKANLLKDADVNVKKNAYWAGIIDGYTKYGIDGLTEYKKIVEAVTPEQISAFLKNKVLVSGNKLSVVMRPE
ncbi:MAG: insulinase family protein [Clostridium sp.]|nr:insulinase family protein [Clostridium sp.]